MFALRRKMNKTQESTMHYCRGKRGCPARTATLQFFLQDDNTNGDTSFISSFSGSLTIVIKLKTTSNISSYVSIGSIQGSKTVPFTTGLLYFHDKSCEWNESCLSIWLWNCYTVVLKLIKSLNKMVEV